MQAPQTAVRLGHLRGNRLFDKRRQAPGSEDGCSDSPPNHNEVAEKTNLLASYVGTKSLNQGHRAAFAFTRLQARLLKQIAPENSLHHLKNNRDQLRLGSQAQPKRKSATTVPIGARALRESHGQPSTLQSADILRAPHDRQKPRRLHENATSLSCVQSAQRSRKKPCARMPHSSTRSLAKAGRVM